MRKGLFVLGLGISALAVTIFYLIFFMLAPFVASTLPPGPWHQFLSLVIYVLIGWFGGVALPAVILFFGLAIMFTSTFGGD